MEQTHLQNYFLSFKSTFKGLEALKQFDLAYQYFEQIFQL